MAVPSLAEIKKQLSKFAKQFKDAANEQQQASIFWTRFYECFGIKPEAATIYEQQVSKLSGATGRIDSFIPGKLIVEHKSKGKDLDKAYVQAQEYFLALPAEEQPKYIITSDFARIRLYDLRAKKSYECTLADLPKHASWFKFLIEEESGEIIEETPINRNAAYAISKLHEALLRANFKGRDLEVFLTRLLFCLFADDTEIFGENGLFRRLVERTKTDGTDLGARLTELFDVLNQPVNDRQVTLDADLNAFAYVNGSLFKERTRIPAFDSDLRELLMACVTLDWSLISPAIFGAMFQGVLEAHSPDEKRQATRRELGAHYTSERNILRVINPLFMDELRSEFDLVRRSKANLQSFYDKLSTLTFFDPACGCGNFLVIAYRELRLLENDVIEELFGKFSKGQAGLLDVSTLCRVRVSQFYGIEIDEAAAHIARVAMWITDHQMNEEAAKRFGNTRPTIPLVDSPTIVCANALRIDWNTVLPSDRCNYVLGNPPFIGKKFQSKTQKEDLQLAAGTVKHLGLLDYVCGWYFKACNYLTNPKIGVAFVSTNSITQGEQVSILWGELLKKGITINFAHRTFRWKNEGKGVAAVHCVVIGFGIFSKAQKLIFDYKNVADKTPAVNKCAEINPYLVNAPVTLLENRKTPICNVPEISYGSFALDDGNFTLTESEHDDFVARVSSQGDVLRPFIGAREFLHNEKRYAIWLKDVPPNILKEMPDVMERVRRVKEWRSKSDRENTRELAATPTVFAEIRQPQSMYLAIPTVSSERRAFVPIAMIGAEVIASNQLYVVANADNFHFGILTSTFHNAWIRAICGRLKSDLRYSASIAYNNFTWPQSMTKDQEALIVEAAKNVLDVRAMFSGVKLADLYDPLTMPPSLFKAHQQLDKAVDAAYGYKGASDDASRVAFLFKLYEKYTSLLPSTASKKTRKAEKV